jgi:hypothetical protein
MGGGREEELGYVLDIWAGTLHTLCSMLQLLVTANAVPSPPIIFTLMMEVIVLQNISSYKSQMA